MSMVLSYPNIGKNCTHRLKKERRAERARMPKDGDFWNGHIDTMNRGALGIKWMLLFGESNLGA